MLSKKIFKIINLLPKGIIIYISKKIIDYKLNKYSSVEVLGNRNLKEIKTPTIFICNHLSNSDGLILSKVLKKIDPTFVAGIKLNKNSITKIGMNVVKTTAITPNSADRKGIKNIINIIKEGESVLIFPEGTRSRKKSMLEAKRGILLIAKSTGAPIVPIGIYGSEKLLPINSNEDMSLEKFHNAKVIVKIGDQFELPKRNKKVGKKEYEKSSLDYMMNEIAKLLPEQYRGFYN